MNYENTRISKLRDYLFEIVNTLTTNRKYQINIDMLENKLENYSLNKMPAQTVVEQWITGDEICVDKFTFRTRKAYSQDVIINLENIGFFEEFENIIEENNKNKIFPDIEGIEKIECLSCGTLRIADTNTAIFDIQIQITYIRNNESEVVSL